MPSLQEYIAFAAAGSLVGSSRRRSASSPCARPSLAAALVIVSSFVKTMIPLRCLAVGGNLGFLDLRRAPSVRS